MERKRIDDEGEVVNVEWRQCRLVVVVVIVVVAVTAAVMVVVKVVKVEKILGS